jgi:molecular chaperone GrpE
MAKQSKEEKEAQAHNNTENNNGDTSNGNGAENVIVETATISGAELNNASPEQLRQLVEQEQKKATEYLDAFQRSRADFLNLKRRTEQERTNIGTEARERVFKKLLPIVDDFERAINNTPENLKGEAWVSGVTLIESKLKKLLDQEGVEEVPSHDTEFNPHVHEAVARDEESEGNTDWVTEVYQKGYKMGDKIIRPAVVKVGRK